MEAGRQAGDEIRNTQKINAVVVGGKLFPRASLEEMLANAETAADKKSIAETLLKAITEKDVASAIKQYHELKATQSGGYNFSEGELPALGYNLLGMKKKKEAIEVFKLNAEVYPSYDSYDGLGQAYLLAGEKELAIQSYRKSLELNPKNTNAIEVLKKLSGTP